MELREAQSAPKARTRNGSEADAPATPEPTPAPAADTTSKAAAPARKKGRGRTAFAVLGTLVGIVLAVIGGYAFLTRNEESTDDAQIDADVVAVAPQVGGRIAEVPVHSDEHVKAGQLLLQIDTSDLDARLAQARAQLGSARAQVDAAEAQERITSATAHGGLESARAMVSGSRVALNGSGDQIATARAELERAQADARQKELDLHRTRQLERAGAVAQQQVNHAQLDYDSARAALSRAQSNLAAAQSERRNLATQVSAAQGHLAESAPVDAQIAAAHAATELARARAHQAEAAVHLAELQLGYARVTAPVDATVSNLNAEVGQIVVPGQPVASLVPDRTYVVANFKETQIGDMRPGNRAVVNVDAYPNHDIEGVVVSLAAGTGARFSLLPANNATGNFVKVVQRVPVHVAFRHRPDLPLQAGLSATVTVHTNQRVPLPPRPARSVHSGGPAQGATRDESAAPPGHGGATATGTTP